VNDVWGWITMSLGAGMIIPYLMRWYWYRTNGYGYGASLFIGAFFAVVAKIIFTATGYELPEYYTSVIISAISFISCVVVSLLTPATSPDVLVKL
jgi:Na+/proline symporter